MPNSVYHRTHDTLAHLVSGRVATRVLHHGLTEAGEDADTVDVAAMRGVLLTTVLDDLDDVFPRRGIERTLQTLLDDLEAEMTGATPTETPAPARGGVDATRASAVPEAAVPEAAVPEPHAPEPVVPEPDASNDDPAETPWSPERVAAALAATDVLVTDPGLAAVPTPDPEAAEATPGATPGPTPEPIHDHSDPARIATALVRFAELDHVNFVGAARRNGRLLEARGEGVDPHVLARRAASCLALVERGGPLHTFTLQTGDANLVLAPIGGDLAIVVGTPKLNLGAVFAARSALEEEL